MILQGDPGIAASADTPQAAQVIKFAPEAISIHVDTPHPAILSIALPQYPGWYATIDNAPANILRAYGGLSAIVVPEGDHLVQLVYNPLSYRVGVSLSLFTWLGVGILGIVLIIRSRYAINRSPSDVDHTA